MRILITGSRDWEDGDLIKEVLSGFLAPDMVLVSGHCPTGADAMGEAVATSLGWTVEYHPARWDKHGKAAGFIRNAEMVALGANACVAFIRNASKGATFTADLAEAKGIPTERFEVFDEDGR